MDESNSINELNRKKKKFESDINKPTTNVLC